MSKTGTRIAKRGQIVWQMRQLVRRISSLYVKDRGASWRTAVRLASPQISVPSGSGEAGADEQFVAVFGQHLLDRSSAGGATRRQA